MSTNRITPASTLLETLRAIAPARSNGTRRGSGAKPDTHVAPRHDVTALRQRLRDTVANMDMDDADSATDARNAAVREILLWEFGSEFRNDSQFSSMADAIGKAFDTDPALRKQFAELVEGLRRA